MTGSKRFSIAIDTSPLNDGNSVRGVGYYTKNLIEALQHEVKTNPEYHDFDISLVTSKNDPALKTAGLIHYPFFDPFKLTLPSGSKTPFIVTVHDLIPRAFKSHFPVGLKGEFTWHLQKNRLKLAKYIIAVSHYSKYSIVDLVSYPADHIYVTYEAADSAFKPIKDQKLLDKIKAKYHLPDKFILYVGDINWNKNIPNLVKACLRLDYPLVIVGSAAVAKVPDHPWTQDILWLQKQSNANLILAGFVPDEDLPAFYNLATVYCQPSYAEGFGLPLVQAMQSGCPLIYSQETSLPEVADFNGEFFDPYDQNELVTALQKMWSDSSLRQKYSLQGLKHAQNFSWAQTAIQTLAVYRLSFFDEN